MLLCSYACVSSFSAFKVTPVIQKLSRCLKTMHLPLRNYNFASATRLISGTFFIASFSALDFVPATRLISYIFPNSHLTKGSLPACVAISNAECPSLLTAFTSTFPNSKSISDIVFAKESERFIAA